MLARVDHDGASDPQRAGGGHSATTAPPWTKDTNSKEAARIARMALGSTKFGRAPHELKERTARTGRGNFHGRAVDPLPRRSHAGASVPFPTFVSSRRTHFYERRRQRDTSESILGREPIKWISNLWEILILSLLNEGGCDGGSI